MKRSSTYSTPVKKAKTVYKRSAKKSFYAIPRPLVQYKSGFPKQLAITHKYTASHQMSWTTPNANVQYIPYGVNCLYDPYLLVGGSQPLYFQQMAAIYNHYTVMKSRIRCTIVPNRNEAFVGGIYIDDDVSPAVTALDVVTQQPSAVSKASQRDAEVLTVYKSWDCKSVFGPNPLDNDKLQGNVGANPDEYQAFIVFARPVVTISDSVVFDVRVTVEYDTVWNELKVMTGS